MLYTLLPVWLNYRDKKLSFWPDLLLTVVVTIFIGNFFLTNFAPKKDICPQVTFAQLRQQKVVYKLMGVGVGQGGLACCDSWGLIESDSTERLIWSVAYVSGSTFLFYFIPSVILHFICILRGWNFHLFLKKWDKTRTRTISFVINWKGRKDTTLKFWNRISPSIWLV